MTGSSTSTTWLTLDLRTRIEAVDERLASCLGYSTDDLLGGPLSGIIALESITDIGTDLVALVESGRTRCTGARELRRRDGSTVPAILSLTARTGPGNALRGFRASVIVDPDRQALAQAMSRRVVAANESLFRSLTETSASAIARLDPDDNITYANPQLAHLAPRAAAPGTPLLDLVHPPDRPRVARVLRSIVAEATAPGEVQCRLGDGDTARWVTLRFVPVLDEELGRVATTVTAERVAGLSTDGEDPTKSELAYLATHDSLTGLPNRGLLLDHMQLALARSERDGRPIAVLFIDLDRFKVVNDTYGHEAGDELLKDIAQRVAGVIRPSDTVARLGGDEFVVLCEEIEGEVGAMTIADRIHESLASGTLLVGATPVDTTVSIGVALSGAANDTPESLLGQADAAMYRAKRSGRDRIELFDEVLRNRNRRREDMRRQLEEALEGEGGLTVHYQPIVDLSSGRISAVEALARWDHPSQGHLVASDFIELAVASRLDSRLDNFVLDRAFADAADWHRRLGENAPRLHVNATARSVSSGSLVAGIERNLALTEVPATKICVELSESLLMADLEGSEHRLERIHELGVGLAIDNVGSAATSLTRLRRFRLDMLKVDRSLTAELLSDPVSVRVAGAAVAVGRAMHLTVAADAVEDKAAIPLLRKLGAELAQGTAFSPALPAGEVAKLFALRSTIV